jgi:hypothetical protein
MSSVRTLEVADEDGAEVTLAADAVGLELLVNAQESSIRPNWIGPFLC